MDLGEHMIKSIELVNWKTHKNSKIEFRKGVNVFVGVMGAGKSSVMDAVSFALFGSFPNLSQKRVSLNGVIMNRPEEMRNAEVRLVFDIDNDEYAVTRKISVNSESEAILEKNGNNVQSQPKRVNEAISELLKVDYDTFTRAVYAQQNQLDYFLDLSKSERKKGIDQMLGLDNFTAAEENITSLINSTRSMIESEEQMLSKINIKEFREQLEKLEMQKSDNDRLQSELAGEGKKLAAQMSDLSAKLDMIKKRYEEKKKVEHEISGTKARLETLNEEIKKLGEGISEAELSEKYTAAKQKSIVIEKEFEKLRSEEKKAANELSVIDARARIITENISAKNKLLLELEKFDKHIEDKVDAAAKELDRLKELNISKKSKIEETKKSYKELETHTGKCPVCERELEEDLRKSLLKEKSLLIESLEKEIGANAKIFAAKDAELKEFTQKYERMKRINEKLEEYKNAEKDKEATDKEIAAKKIAVKEITEKVEEKERERNALKEELNKFEAEREKMERKKRYIKGAGECTVKLEELKILSEKLKVDEKEIYLLQDEFTSASSKNADIKSKLESNRKYAESLNQQIAEKKKNIEAFGNIEKKIQKKRIMLSDSNKFKAALIETEASLRNKLVSSVNSIMQSVWPELYPYADYQGLKLNTKKDDYSLEASLVINGESSWVPIDSVASGGERSTACLTMRIALAMVIIPNLKWIILDEPTHNIDSNGINNLIEVMGNNLPKIVEQIFIITHDETLKQINDAAVFLLERDKSVYGESVVSNA